MGLRVNTERSLVWDNNKGMMVKKTAVFLEVVSNKGNTMYVSKKLYIENMSEIEEAKRSLILTFVRESQQ